MSAGPASTAENSQPSIPALFRAGRQGNGPVGAKGGCVVWPRVEQRVNRHLQE
jgi:hypothetical protein